MHNTSIQFYMFRIPTYSRVCTMKMGKKLIGWSQKLHSLPTQENYKLIYQMLILYLSTDTWTAFQIAENNKHCAWSVSKEIFGFGLPTPSERRRVEYIFIFAVICVRIGENFEVFGLIESRERTAFERALRLFLVRDVAGGCPQLRDSFVLLLVSGVTFARLCV